MENIPNVTVIVPIFNSEGFLHQCIDSIVKQDEKNIEIILIDDGSTDSSPSICDKYSSMDKRVKVIHKNNEGQGAARNLGLSLAIGKNIVFVDSDDYLSHDFLSRMLNMQDETDSDVVLCSYYCIKEDGTVIGSFNDSGSIIKKNGFSCERKIIKTEEAVKSMLYAKTFDVQPWAKLYRKKLWNGVKFSNARNSQDLATTYKVLAKANNVTFEDIPLMYYRYRDDSITRKKFSAKKMVALDIAYEIVDYTRKYLPYALKAAYSRAVATGFFLYMQIPEKGNDNDDCKKRCYDVIKQYRMIVIFDKESRIKTRVAVALSFFSMSFVRKVFLYIRKKRPTF